MKITISVYEDEPGQSRSYCVTMPNEASKQEIVDEFDNLLLTMFAADPVISEELKTIAHRLIDSRTDTVGDEHRPKTLVETFWLNKLADKIFEGET